MVTQGNDPRKKHQMGGEVSKGKKVERDVTFKRKVV